MSSAPWTIAEQECAWDCGLTVKQFRVMNELFKTTRPDFDMKTDPELYYEYMENYEAKIMALAKQT